MMKRLNEKLHERSGSAYILTCVLVIFTCVLMVFAISFIAGISHIRVQKQEAQTVLDSYIADNAVDIYSALKGEINLGAVLNDTAYLEELTDFSGLTPRTLDGQTVYVCYTDPEADVWSYYITAPTLSFTGTGTAARMRLDYTVAVPVRFSESSTVTVVKTEISLTSNLNLNEE